MRNFSPLLRFFCHGIPLNSYVDPVFHVLYWKIQLRIRMSQLDKAICTDESISLVENSINSYYFVVTYFYRLPTKLWEGNVFNCVCLSVQRGPIWPLSMMPWTSPYSPHRPSPPPYYRSLLSLLVTSSRQDQKPVRTCSIEHPPPVLISGAWLFIYNMDKAKSIWVLVTEAFIYPLNIQVENG